MKCEIRKLAGSFQASIESEYCYPRQCVGEVRTIMLNQLNQLNQLNLSWYKKRGKTGKNGEKRGKRRVYNRLMAQWFTFCARVLMISGDIVLITKRSKRWGVSWESSDKIRKTGGSVFINKRKLLRNSILQSPSYWLSLKVLF